MSVSSLILVFVGGAFAGTFGVMLGLGGGVFLIPFLVLVLQVPMHQAIATSIVAVIATSSAGAAMNLERQTVNIRLGMTLETTTVAGAILGGLTASFLSATVLARIFGVLLLAVSGIMIWRRAPSDDSGGGDGVLPAAYYDESRQTVVTYSVNRLPATMGVSFLAGNLSGLLGIGGGIFKVPAMTLLSGVPMKAAAATSNFMIGVTAAAGAYIYFAHGYVNPVLTASATLGVFAGTVVGVSIAKEFTTRTLTILFAVVLLIAAFQLLTRS
ncbi:MAG: sulfite exporter TauE/SafE family protein [Ignavibacteriales bacterium]|nr:sulfite exporter TauE/SafE family protein [Ignavibacteriales bacterium]